MNNDPSFLERFSHAFARWTTTSHAFVAATAITCVWLLLGVHFDYSNAWLSSLNSFTSIITFLMLFLMQRAQKKDLQALHLKLNEIISIDERANNNLINIERSSEADLEAMQQSHEAKSPTSTPPEREQK